MAPWADLGFFNTGTGAPGALSAITGLPESPDFVLFFAVSRSSAGNGAHAPLFVGMATATDMRGWSRNAADGSTGASDTARDGRDDACLVEITSAMAEAGLLTVAFTSDGFTPSVGATFTTDTRVMWFAVGGLTGGVKIMSLTSNATGNQDFTGAGFNPAGGILGLVLTTSNGIATDSYWSMGCFDGSRQVCLAGFSADAQDNSANVRSMISTTFTLAHLAAGSDTTSAVWTATPIADGVRLNRDVGTTARRVFALLIEDPAFRVFTNGLVDTGTADFSVALDSGKTPVGAVVLARPPITTTQTAPATPDELAIGAAVSATKRGAIWAGVHEASTNQTAHALSETRVLIDHDVTNEATVQSDVDFKAPTSGNLNFDQITGSGTAWMFGGFVIQANDLTGGAVVVQQQL